MKRKIALISLLFMTILFILSNGFFETIYHVNLFDYFFNSNELTEEDREYLREYGPIIYASDNNSPPLRYFDQANQQYRGLVIDYLQALALELETEILFEPMVWEEALKTLENGDSDICDMYPSKERERIYLFSDPIYYQRGIILVPKDDNSIQNMMDLKGKTVGIQTGDYVYEFLKNAVDGINYSFDQDYEENLNKLVEGKVDAIVGDEPVISYFLDLYELSDDYKIVDQPLYELPSVLSLNKENKRLQAIINKGVFNLNQTDIMAKIQQKWFGISTPIGSTDRVTKITIYVVAGSFGAALVFLLIFLWNIELKKAVDEQTKALQENQNNLQMIIDGINQMIVVMSEDYHIISANKLFFKFFEIEDYDTFYNSYPVVYENILKLVKDDLKSCELLLKGRSCHVSVFRIHYDNQADRSCLLVIEDITDKKVNEARMLQENKMAAVGQLATGIAHEIRNPLGLIRNYAYLMKKRPVSEKVLEQSIAVIENSVDKASTIIDNLLNFSRITDETVVDVNLKPFIEDLMTLNDKQFNRGKVRYKLVLENLGVRTMEESLKHILINIINNAVDAMTSKGQLTIWLHKNEKSIYIHIIDNGTGMSRETLERLYDPFFTTKPVGQGTGLGLYIAFNELEKIQGKISVLSKVNKGTTFKIQLNDLN